MKITFKQAKELISSRVNGCEKYQSAQLADILWLAETEAWASGQWWGQKRRIFVRNIENRIVLPAEWNVLEGINYNGIPQQIQSTWFQFNPSGTGSDWGCCDVPTDVIDYLEVPTVWKIHQGERVAVKPLVSEDADAHVIIQGRNSDGGEVYRYYSERDCDERVDKGDLGEKLPLKVDGVNETHAQFANDGITNIFKPATRGPVKIYATGPRYMRELVELAPSQTESSLRSYAMPGCCSSCEVIEALVKRREPVRYTQDHEVIQIESVTALISLCLSAYYKYNKFDPEKATYYLADGIKALNGQLTEKNGAAQHQIRVWPGAARARNKRRSPASY